jgi:hypothetical protein
MELIAAGRINSSWGWSERLASKMKWEGISEFERQREIPATNQQRLV